MERLDEVVAGALGEGVRIEGLARLSGGASRETWAFDAVAPDGAVRPLVLQRARPPSEGPRSAAPGMGVEAAVLRLARAAGVPVAEVLAADATGEVLGAPFVLSDRIEGETIARRILRDDAFAAARQRLTAQYARALAAVHSIPPSSVPELEPIDQVTYYREVLDESGQPHPAFELAFRWLEANRPPSTRTTVVHGDFRLGNVIVDPEGLVAVLDWELVHVGDPIEDLGWLCVKAWRFGEPGPVGGVGSYEELLDAYGEAAGVAVEREVLRWWEVLGTLKWGIMCFIQASYHLTGVQRSVELAAIGRRVCENEHDVLELLP